MLQKIEFKTPSLLTEIMEGYSKLQAQVWEDVIFSILNRKLTDEDHKDFHIVIIQGGNRDWLLYKGKSVGYFQTIMPKMYALETFDPLSVKFEFVPGNDPEIDKSELEEKQEVEN